MKRCKNRITGQVYYYALGKAYFSHLTWDVYRLYLDNNTAFYWDKVNVEDFYKLYIDLEKFERIKKLKQLNEMSI
jgi:hypothetical protein